MRLAELGKRPSGKRLQRIKKSSNFKDGSFRNLHHTPMTAEGYTICDTVFDAVFKKNKALRPPFPLPVVITDLHALNPGVDLMIWFGHSSYFIQIKGKTFLIDPVFTKNFSPVSGTYTAFEGTDIYTASDLPEIDYLIITHDHFDHLHYPTVTSLQEKIKKVICGLGVGSHFEYWGYQPGTILETDWYDQVTLEEGISILTAPARHGSGRGLTFNNTLWCSYMLSIFGLNIYIGGDSGYDDHFAELGERFEQVDIAILDNGQYDKMWKYLHLLPEDVIQAAKDLKARKVFPVHNSKFPLANHAWDEPLRKISELGRDAGIPVITPMIGQPVYLRDEKQRFSEWWLEVDFKNKPLENG